MTTTESYGCDKHGEDAYQGCAMCDLEALRSRLADEQERHAQLQARCFDQGSQSVFDAVREARERLVEADALIAKGLAVVHDFLPNIGRCVLQDYQRMNEFCSEAAARTTASKFSSNGAEP